MSTIREILQGGLQKIASEAVNSSTREILQGGAEVVISLTLSSVCVLYRKCLSRLSLTVERTRLEACPEDWWPASSLVDWPRRLDCAAAWPG